jgi:hypothetical protein
MNLRSSFALVFAYCWIISGCSDPSPVQKKDSLSSPIVHDTVALSADTTKNKVVNTENAIGCYYVLNDQYAGSPDSSRLLQWLNPFVQNLSETGIVTSKTLFGEGGGPNGAQWNPGADLLVAVYVNGKPEVKKNSYQVNSYDMRKFPHGVKFSEKGNAAVCWFIIPMSSWQVLRHLPSKEEKQFICRERNINEKDWIKNATTLINVSVAVPVADSTASFSEKLLMSFGE